MIFTKTLPKIMKLNLIPQIINYMDCYQKEKIKNVIGLMKHKLNGKIIIKFVSLRAKTNTYLIDDGCEDKKRKRKKNVWHKKKTFKFKHYTSCLEATELENKISYLEIKIKLT